MLSIVCLHIINAGGGYTNSNGFVDNLLWMIFYIIIVSSVNIFAMLSGYLYSNKTTIKNKNIVSLLLNTIFYYFLITAVFVIFSKDTLSIKDIITGIFPPMFGKNWYIVCYVFMFFCIPYINLFVKEIPKKAFEKLLILLFVLLSIVPTFGLYDYFRTNYGYSPWWLIYCYMIGSYIKLYDLPKNIKLKCVKVCIFIVSLCVVFVLGNMLIFHKQREFFTTILTNYTSPNTVFIAAIMLILFKNMRIPNFLKKFIGALSASSFGVYIIHAHPFVMEKIFEGNFAFLDNYNSFLAILGVVIICVLVYIICSLIDYIRVFIFKIIHINKIVDYIGKKLDNILSVRE